MNLFRDPYDYHTDADGVVWRLDTRRPEAAPIKALDPNFVHERVPTPKGLDYTIYALVALIVLLVGALVGAAL